MKRIITAFIACMLLTCTAGAVDLYVDTNKVATDTPPAIVEGRTLVPVRAIFEAIGATVEWDNTTRTATGAKSGTIVSIQIDNTTAYVNGEARTLDVPAQLINNRTMVPARFISEAMGCEVTWYQPAQTAAVANYLKGRRIYVTETGERYHFDGNCNGGTYYEATLAEAMGRGLTACDKCVLTSGGTSSAPAPQPTTDLPSWLLVDPVPAVPVEPEPAFTPEPERPYEEPVPDRNDRTVYVSNRSNTIHSVNNCGGMKKYREMSRSDADAKGYKYCPNCW